MLFLTTRLGEGEFVYEVAGDWGELPDGWTLGDVAAAAVAATTSHTVMRTASTVRMTQLYPAIRLVIPRLLLESWHGPA